MDFCFVSSKNQKTMCKITILSPHAFPEKMKYCQKQSVLGAKSSRIAHTKTAKFANFFGMDFRFCGIKGSNKTV
jgi:hypothetical protein